MEATADSHDVAGPPPSPTPPSVTVPQLYQPCSWQLMFFCGVLLDF